MSDKPEEELSAILYTDGGYRMQFRSGGWGVHGYTYLDKPPTQGTGNPKCHPTAQGYAEDKTKGKAVTLTSYINGCGGVPDAISNNHTELQATIKGLQWVEEKKYKQSQLFTDSRYVVDGLTKWVDKWQRLGWKNSEGNPIANQDLWKEAVALMEKITFNKQEVNIQWIKGHNGNFGNEMADLYASRGNVLGRKGHGEAFMREDQAQGFWSKKCEFNRLIGSGRWYFQTTDYDFMTQDGKTIYYVGDPGDDDDPGKRNSDNSMAVLYLNEPDPVLEKIRLQAIELDVRKSGSVMVGRLDTILTPNFYNEVLEHDCLFLDYGGRLKNLVTAKKKVVVEEKAPAGLAYIAIGVLNLLQGKLDAFLEKKPGLWVTDITDLLYDVEEKKTGHVKKLKKEITQSTKYLDVQARYSTKFVKDITGEDDPSVKTTKIRLIMGRDLPKRNSLSNVATAEPKLSLVTWRESDEVIRFATVLETNAGVGIWSGVDANYLLV